MARRDDSNRMVFTVTAFNSNTARDPLVVSTLLAVLILLVLWFYDTHRKVP